MSKWPLLQYRLEDFSKVIYYCNKALEIKKHTKSYINEVFSWDNTIYDLLSIAYFYNKDIDSVIYNINIAIEMDPCDDRLKKNRELFLNVKNNI